MGLKDDKRYPLLFQAALERLGSLNSTTWGQGFTIKGGGSNIEAAAEFLATEMIAVQQHAARLLKEQQEQLAVIDVSATVVATDPSAIREAYGNSQ